MKNIHILPTDKPSRLVRSKINGNIFLDPHKKFVTAFEAKFWEYLNLYINSEEEIKEGDWVITPTNDIIQWAKVFQPIGKKIILTTDKYLIKNGIQEIDDNFLKWFFKPKQETLEEVVERYSANELSQLGFKNGAKWQEEQDKKLWSDEEVFSLITDLVKNSDFIDFTREHGISGWDELTKWFEQYKKK